MIAGVNGYKMAKSEEYKQLATAAFVGGWMVVAAAISGMSVRSVLAFGSAIAVVVGALLSRMAIDQGTEPSKMAMAIFLGGWAGITLSIAWGASGMGVGAAIGATLLTLAGVFVTARGEKGGNKMIENVGKILFALGWVGVALAVGYSQISM